MPLHGTHSRYCLGCRCADCRSGNRRYRREYRARTAGCLTAITLYDGGMARSFLVSDRPPTPQGKSKITITDKGRAYLAALRGETL